MPSAFPPRSLFTSSSSLQPESAVATHRIVSLLRESAGRFAQQSGWKRHVPWLVGALGRTLSLSSVFLYKNYPDSEGNRTAVRLNSWKDPLDSIEHTDFDAGVIRYTETLWSQLASRLERNVPIVWKQATSPQVVSEILDRHGICSLLVVPVFAGTEWWGFLGGFASAASPEDLGESDSAETVASEVFSTVAVQLGSAVSSASVEQALRWSERLHRIQRDIALAGAHGRSGEESLAELLAFVCELGGFEAGSVETLQGDTTVVVASRGDPPARTALQWYQRASSSRVVGEPLYIGSAELADLAVGTPVEHAFHSGAILPIVYQSKVSGVIQLFSKTRTSVPESVRRSLEAVTAEIAVLTTQVQTSEQVRIINDRYRRAVTDGQIGVWELDLSAARFSMDPPTPEMFGLPVDQRSIRLSEVLAALSPRHRQEVLALLRSPRPDDERISLEGRFTLPTGERRWYAIRARRHASEGPARVTGTVVDITQPRAFQEELSAARKLADESSRAKSEFLARMSHELRTPLNAILGHAQMLRIAGHPQTERPIDTIEQSARHLMEMVDNILSQDSLEAGRMSIATTAVATRELTQMISEEVAVLFQDSSVAFSVICSDSLPARINVDPTRIRQVLHNLIGNAAKFTTRGSVRLHVRWKGRRLRFSVTDTGPGIPAADLHDIFVPFRHRAQPRSGTGLGLSICAELARLMGSRIRVKSTEGEGSCFWFSLRIDSDAPRTTSLPGVSRTSDRPAASVTRPPEAELAPLRRLVQIGDIAGVRRFAEDRVALHPAGTFYELVRSYSQAFRLRELRDLVESVTDE